MSKTSKPKQSSTTILPESLPVTPPDVQLHDLLIDGLKDIYWAENQLVKVLPAMAAAAGNAELVNTLAAHLEVTTLHVSRLEEIFALLNENAQGQKCDAMEGLTREGEAIIEDTESGSVARDTGILMAARKVEHYEIATYAGLHSLAEKQGLDEVSDLLAQTLSEEQEADQNLAALADSL